LRKIFIFVFLFFCFSIQISAQDNWTIESITFEGLEKTNPSFLKKFIQSKEGDFFVTKQLQKDIQQMKNLGLHYPITSKVDSLPNQKVRITYQFVEKKTLLPIINFGGISENIWYQIGLTDFNFLGRGHQVLAFYQNSDNRSGGQLFYRIPFAKKKWGFAVNALIFKSEEPVFFPEGTVYYDYDNLNFGLTGIYNLDFQKRIEFGANFFRELYNKNGNQIIPNPPGPAQLSLWKTSSKIEYIDSKINYDDFYLEGFSWSGIWQTVFTYDNSEFFNSLIFQVRKFNRIGRNGNFAARFRFGISTNNNSPFAPFVVDSRVNLRGSGNRIERGTGQLILNLEYRHTLKQFKNWGLQSVIFSDMGNWRSPGGTLNEFFEKEELRQFVGGGFRLIYRKIYNSILRVDYGVNIFDTKMHGIVLGIGQYF